MQQNSYQKRGKSNKNVQKKTVPKVIDKIEVSKIDKEFAKEKSLKTDVLPTQERKDSGRKGNSRELDLDTQSQKSLHKKAEGK